MKGSRFFKWKNSPAFKQLFLREMGGPHQSNEEQTEEYRQWNELMPITNASIRYRKQEVLQKTSVIEPEIEMIISEDNFKRFGLKASDRVRTIPTQTCLHTVVMGNAQDIDSKKWLDEVRRYLKKNDLLLNGDIITSLLLVLSNPEAEIRFDEAWIPISDR